MIYTLVLVSDDPVFLKLAERFITAMDPNFQVHISSKSKALDTWTSLISTDIMVLDESDRDSLHGFVNNIDRHRLDIPIVLTAQSPTEPLLAEAIDRNIGFFVTRKDRDLHDLFTELLSKSLLLAERKRNDRDRKTNEARMEALIEIAKMGNHDFKEVVKYSLEKSVEITRSRVGYVALYEPEQSQLRMLAWSSEAVSTCRVDHSPIIFDLDKTGIWGEPIRTGRSVKVNDYGSITGSAKKGTPEGHIDLRRILMVPIYLEGELIGTAGVANKATDYTESDEVQLNLLMVELFTIYNRVQDIKRYRGYHEIIRTFSDKGPVGFLFLDKDYRIVFINKQAESILGIEPEGSTGHDLKVIRTPNADSVRNLLDTCRASGSSHRMHMDAPNTGQMFECSVDLYNDGTMEGYTVWFIDVTFGSLMNSDRSKAIDHVRILEGPILRSLIDVRDILVPLGDITDDAFPALIALDNTVTFMSEYMNVGKESPQWMSLTETVRKGAEMCMAGTVNLKIDTDRIEIMADPEFPFVFKNLINNSIFHGKGVMNISVSFRIDAGELTIVFKDDGIGISAGKCEHLFDQIPEGKFGLYFIKTVTEASGFTVKCVPSTDGACFEITVPPTFYRLC